MHANPHSEVFLSQNLGVMLWNKNTLIQKETRWDKERNIFHYSYELEIIKKLWCWLKISFVVSKSTAIINIFNRSAMTRNLYAIYNKPEIPIMKIIGVRTDWNFCAHKQSFNYINKHLCETAGCFIEKTSMYVPWQAIQHTAILTSRSCLLRKSVCRY